MNLRRSILQGVVAGGGLWLLSPAVRAQPASLDGRRFDGVFIQRGKTSGDADTLTFAGGRFRSSACDRYGYGDAPYRISVLGDAIAFEAETVSAKHGRLIWRGVVRGDKLDAVALAQRDGKPAVENWVVAGTPK
jgi:hypothetical protein